MGQKVNPNALRCDINRTWISKWEANSNKQAAQWIIEDEKIRNFFLKNYKTAQIVETIIERTQKTIHVIVKAGQPALIQGKALARDAALAPKAEAPVAADAAAPAEVKPVETADVKKAPKAKKLDNVLEINKIVGRKIKVTLDIVLFENVALSARVLAREIADAIENRVSFRVAQKMAIKKAMMAHVKGIKTNVSGRLGGVEMAREEGYSQGVIPLSTFRANIDYALEEAKTTYGQIGVKVWINRGDVFRQIHRNNHKFGDKKDGKKPFDRRRNPRRRNEVREANVLRLPKEDKKVVAKAPAAKKDGE